MLICTARALWCFLWHHNTTYIIETGA